MKSKKCLYPVLAAFGLFCCGCGGNEKAGPAEIPKDLNQPLPKVAAPAGGGSPKAKPTNPTGQAD